MPLLGDGLMGGHGGMGDRRTSNILKIAREFIKLFSVIFFLLLVTLVGQMVKTPPSPTESASVHLSLCYHLEGQEFCLSISSPDQWFFGGERLCQSFI